VLECCTHGQQSPRGPSAFQHSITPLFEDEDENDCAPSKLTMRRVPQPPINPATRDPERHEFWAGLVAAVIGLLLVYAGLKHSTGIDTVEGDAAGELQLIKAFALGGLRYPEPASPPPLRSDDPEASAEALDRWAKQQAQAQPPTWKVRVDTAAKTPCPT
jgi:hypothetical protein